MRRTVLDELVDALAPTQPAPCTCGRGADLDHSDCDWLTGATTFGPTARELAEQELADARVSNEVPYREEDEEPGWYP